MVKSAEDRKAKYESKFDATVVQARYTTGAVNAKARAAVMADKLQDINSTVRGILNSAGILAINTVPYQAFGMKLLGICNRFGGLTTTHALSATATAEAGIAALTFVAYGCDADILRSIWTHYADMLGEAPSPFA